MINSLGEGGPPMVMLRLASFLAPERIFLLEDRVEYPVDRGKLELLPPRFLNEHPYLSTALRYPCTMAWGISLSRRVSRDDVVISFLDEANWVNCWGKAFGGHRAILSVHNDPSRRRGRVLGRKLSRPTAWAYSRADLVVAVSRGIAYFLTESGLDPAKVRVIYNPVDVKGIRAMASEEVEPPLEGLEYLISAGRLARQKGQWHLLRVFRALKESFPDLRLVLLGSGPLKEPLAGLCSSLGLRAYLWDRNEMTDDFDVYFLGFRANPFKYMARARAFVLSSLHEGFPNVLLEAMACGLPVVSSDCPSGPREIISPDSDPLSVAEGVEMAEFGVLVPPAETSWGWLDPRLSPSEEGMLEALAALLDSEVALESYRRSSLARAMEFAPDRIACLWGEVI